MPSLRPNRNPARTSMPDLPITDDDSSYNEGPEKKRRKTMLDQWADPAGRRSVSPKENSPLRRTATRDPLDTSDKIPSVKLKLKLGSQTHKQSTAPVGPPTISEGGRVDTPEATPPDGSATVVDEWTPARAVLPNPSKEEMVDEEYVPNGLNGAARHQTTGMPTARTGTNPTLTPRQSRKGSPFTSTPHSPYMNGTVQSATSSLFESGYTPQFSRHQWDQVIQKADAAAVRNNQPAIGNVLRFLGREYTQDPHSAGILVRVANDRNSETQYQEFKEMYKSAKKHLKRVQRSAKRVSDNINGGVDAGANHNSLVAPLLDTTPRPNYQNGLQHEHQPPQTSSHPNQLDFQIPIPVSSPSSFPDHPADTASQPPADDMRLRRGKEINKHLLGITPPPVDPSPTLGTVRTRAKRSNTASKRITNNALAGNITPDLPADQNITGAVPATTRKTRAATAMPANLAVNEIESSKTHFTRGQTVPPPALDEPASGRNAGVTAKATKKEPSSEDEELLSEVDETLIHDVETVTVRSRRGTPNPKTGRWKEEPPVHKRNYKGGHKYGGRGGSIDFDTFIAPPTVAQVMTAEQEEIYAKLQKDLANGIREQTAYLEGSSSAEYDQEEDDHFTEPRRHYAPDARPLRETGGAPSEIEPKRRIFRNTGESENDTSSAAGRKDAIGGRKTRAAVKSAQAAAKGKAPVEDVPETDVDGTEPGIAGSGWHERCEVCHRRSDGNTLRCNNCPRAYHEQCLDEPVGDGIPPGDLGQTWYCSYCRDDTLLTDDMFDVSDDDYPAYFKPVVEKLNKLRPGRFGLPAKLQTYFEGVSASKGGHNKPPKGTYMYDPETSRKSTKKKQGRNGNETETSAQEDGLQSGEIQQEETSDFASHDRPPLLYEARNGKILMARRMRTIKNPSIMSDADAQKLKYRNHGNVVIVSVEDENEERERITLSEGKHMKMTARMVEMSFIRKTRTAQAQKYAEQQLNRLVHTELEQRVKDAVDAEFERRVQDEVKRRVDEQTVKTDAKIQEYMALPSREQDAIAALAGMGTLTLPPRRPTSPLTDVSSPASSPEPPSPVLSSAPLPPTSPVHSSSRGPSTNTGPAVRASRRRPAASARMSQVGESSSPQAASDTALVDSRKRKAIEPAAPPRASRLKVNVGGRSAGSAAPSPRISEGALNPPALGTGPANTSKKRKASVEDHEEPALRAKRVRSDAETDQDTDKAAGKMRKTSSEEREQPTARTKKTRIGAESEGEAKKATSKKRKAPADDLVELSMQAKRAKSDAESEGETDKPTKGRLARGRSTIMSAPGSRATTPAIGRGRRLRRSHGGVGE